MYFSLRTQLWFLCGGFLVVLFFVALFSHLNSSTLMREFDNVANAQLPAVRAMTLADMMHDGLRSVALAALLAAGNKNAEELTEIANETEEKAGDFQKHLETLENLPLNSATKQAIAEAKPEMQEYIEATRELVKRARVDGYEVAVQSRGAFDQKFKVLEDKMEKLGELIEADASKAHESGGSYRTLSMLSSLTGIIFCLVFGLLVTKGLVATMTKFASRIQESSEFLKDASDKMNSVSQKLASGATESAASLEETVASLEQLSNMVTLNSSHAQKASSLANSSLENSRKGRDAIGKLSGSMEELTGSAQKMEEVIQVIDDIAFQTNLLALNASVEAARAGEQGKGFAVVADAVRTLAQRSADSAKNISEMIKASVNQISHGGQVANESSKIIDGFYESAKSVHEINQEISAASQEQSLGISQINQAMSQVDQASQTNAQVAQEVAHSSENLSALSAEMQKIVAELQNMIGGRKKA